MDISLCVFFFTNVVIICRHLVVIKGLGIEIMYLSLIQLCNFCNQIADPHCTVISVMCE